MPNPFNPSVTIHYVLTPDRGGRYRIFNPQGRVIYRVELPGRANPFRTLVWNGTDMNGKKAPSGLYIGCLETAGAKIRTHRLLLLK